MFSSMMTAVGWRISMGWILVRSAIVKNPENILG